MLAQVTELPPGEPMYQPIPFYPSIVSGSGTQLGASTATQTWANYPARCDLTFLQGDDVMIPLTIEDPSDSTPDMSTAWDWSAQIRVLHSYHSTLVNTFTITDEYTPPAGETPGFTTVNLFLPRSENCYVGSYRWDLYSKSPLDATDFPRPPDVPEPEPWPPTDQIRTWLYGLVTILPRITSTDFLPPPTEITDGGGEQVVMAGYFVGPNGRVP
jgi:hypothetical protein